MARSSRSRTISRRPRRKLVWARWASDLAVGNGGIIALAPLSHFETTYSSQLIGCTLMAIRGTITVSLRGPTFIGGATASGRVRVGMRVTDHADLAPQDYAIDAMFNNQAHADWFMFEPFCLHNSGTIAAAGDEVDTTTASETRQIHVKAMRKFQELDQTLELVAGAPNPVFAAPNPAPNSAPLTCMFDLSMLIALP